MQQCINVTLPRRIGGLEGKAVYLDCDGGLSFRRLDEICQATKAMVLPVLNNVNGDQERFGQRHLLDGVLYKRIDSLQSLVDGIDELASKVLPSNSNVRLLVIDSIAYYFRYQTIGDTLPSNANQHAFLYTLIQRLNMLAHQWGLIVLLTNQVTTKSNAKDDQELLVPALGESWSHCCTTSISLKYCDNDRMTSVETNRDANNIVRKIQVEKSSFLAKQEAYFVVTKQGVRDSTKPLDL